MSTQLTPFLVLDGKAGEAVHYYQQVLGAELLTLSTYKDMPEPVEDHLKDREAYAKLNVGDSDLMLSDTNGVPISQGNHVTICITTQDTEQSRQIFEELKREGKVNVELTETSFSPAFANVTDRYGVTFQILTEE